MITKNHEPFKEDFDTYRNRFRIEVVSMSHDTLDFPHHLLLKDTTRRKYINSMRESIRKLSLYLSYMEGFNEKETLNGSKKKDEVPDK